MGRRAGSLWPPAWNPRPVGWMPLLPTRSRARAAPSPRISWCPSWPARRTRSTGWFSSSRLPPGSSGPGCGAGSCRARGVAAAAAAAATAAAAASAPRGAPPASTVAAPRRLVKAPRQTQRPRPRSRFGPRAGLGAPASRPQVRTLAPWLAPPRPPSRRRRTTRGCTEASPRGERLSSSPRAPPSRPDRALPTARACGKALGARPALPGIAASGAWAALGSAGDGRGVGAGDVPRRFTSLV
mmetsp:Transcript_24604/g.93010  ORF Transcript_24604/g.93010 Transcript_24604/m.93010 type:complete len:241 (+) Transcript_24604:9384-10106(+)